MSSLSQWKGSASAMPATSKAPPSTGFDAGNSAAQESLVGALGGAGVTSTPTLDATGGGAIVGSGSAESQPAYDNDSYSSQLIAWQQQHPGSTIDDAMRALDEPGAMPEGESDVVEVGEVGEATGDKTGVYIGNQNYGTWGQLPGAAADAVAMHRAQSPTYPGVVQADLTGRGLRKALLDSVAPLKPGDGLLFTYAGHGDARGQLGIDADANPTDDQILPSSVIGAAANTARAKGAQLIAVIDSCQSGGATEATRDDRAEEIEREGGLDAQGNALLDVLHGIEGVRDAIVRGDTAPADAADPNAPATRGVRVGASSGGTPGEHLYPALEGHVGTYESLTHLADLRAELRVDEAGWAAASQGYREDIASAMARVVLHRIEASRPDAAG